MIKPCPACAGDGCVNRQMRKDHEGLYEVNEICLSCRGNGFVEDPPVPLTYNPNDIPL